MQIRPLTPDLLPDLERLFAADSVARGCWCLHWRLPTRDRQAIAPADRPARFAAVTAGTVPGLIAHDDTGPAAWVQITPRAQVPRFDAVPTARPADDTPPGTWALSCFFIRRDLRRSGLMTTLARAACTHAASHGATAVEVSARHPGGSMAWGEGFTGLVPSLLKAGFVAVEPRAAVKTLMRWTPK